MFGCRFVAIVFPACRKQLMAFFLLSYDKRGTIAHTHIGFDLYCVVSVLVSRFLQTFFFSVVLQVEIYSSAWGSGICLNRKTLTQKSTSLFLLDILDGCCAPTPQCLGEPGNSSVPTFV